MKAQNIALLGGGIGIVMLATITVGYTQRSPVFIADDASLTKAQIQERLESQGWTNIKLTSDGAYIDASGLKDGKFVKISVDPRTGHVPGERGDGRLSSLPAALRRCGAKRPGLSSRTKSTGTAAPRSTRFWRAKRWRGGSRA